MIRLGSSVRRWSPTKGLVVIGLSILACVVAAAGKGVPAQTSAGDRFVLRAIPASAVHHFWQPPHIRNADGTSLNWSGYAVQPLQGSPPKKGKAAPSPAFTGVAGSWTVPSVSPSASQNTFSSSWVGMDGNSDNTVEQIGTEQDCSGGSAIYYAWFEMYPKGTYEIAGFPVNPGDTISAEVTYEGNGTFELSITNESANISFSTTQRSKSAQRSSAEWIEEAPSWGGVLPLADFGVVDFCDCAATLDGTPPGPISDAAWQYNVITMATGTGTTKAVPSGLSDGGTSFSVSWEHE